MAFGADKDELGLLPPDGNKDYGAAEFLEFREFLQDQGFSGKKVPQSVREQECGGKSLAAAPGFVEEYTRQDRGGKVVVRLFWGVANLFDESSAFYCMVKEGAERSSVFMYSGHSRIGGLDISAMEQVIGQPIRFNQNQYQIFAFFGCSSYGYYNKAYFEAKGGSHNMDIITNGVAGSFYAMDDFNIKTLSPILNWSSKGSKSSWQQIINSYEEVFLTGVNGDE